MPTMADMFCQPGQRELERMQLAERF